MATRYSPKSVTDGLVLSLDAANRVSYPGSGTGWYDLTANRYNGVLTNGPTFSNTNGGCIVFDGVDDFTDIIYLPQQTNSPLSVFAWVYLNTLPSVGVACGIWGHYGISGVNSHFEMYSTYSRLRLGDVNNSTLPVFTTGVWVYAGFTSTGSTHKYYVNTSELASWSGTTGAILGNPGAVSHMTGRSDAGRIWNGRIANINIYLKTLTETEVLQNYNTTKTRFGL